MVCFRSAGVTYCLPVAAARAVRPALGMVSLPAGRPDVTGLMPGDPPLSVLSVLGPGSGHVLVVEAGGKTFGLLVDEVSGLRRIEEADIGPAPDGQARPLVSGTVEAEGGLILVTDPVALAARL